jgi:hypothetical protein
MAAELAAAVPRLGVEDIATSPNLAPTAEDDAMAQEEEPGGAPPEEPPMDEGEPGNPDDEEQRPEESDDERDDMPKAAGRRRPGGIPKQGALLHRTARVRRYAQRERIRRRAEHDQFEAAVQEGREKPFFTAYNRPPQGEETWETMPPETTWLAGATTPSYYRDPPHVGARREAALNPAEPLPEDWYAS